MLRSVGMENRETKKIFSFEKLIHENVHKQKCVGKAFGTFT